MQGAGCPTCNCRRLNLLPRPDGGGGGGGSIQESDCIRLTQSAASWRVEYRPNGMSLPPTPRLSNQQISSPSPPSEKPSPHSISFCGSQYE
eukprot:7196-Hanusia_phi.AAC.6